MSSSEQRPSSSGLPQLAYVDVKPILRALSDLGDAVVLVGGQAVNFWADYYAERLAPALASKAPFTSKDIDLCGDRRAVQLCAERLKGTAVFPTIDEHTPTIGVVSFLDAQGHTRALEVVEPFGTSIEEARRLAIPVEILENDGTGTGLTFHVMHPVLCLETRACNTMGLPGYSTDAALTQLRVSVAVAREFLLDLLSAGEIRAVLNLSERIFRFVRDHQHGKRVYAAHGIDLFDAVTSDERLPAEFRRTRLPQMRAQLGKEHTRAATGKPSGA